MELMTVLTQRFSHRKFEPTPVPHDKLQQLLIAAQIAPTAHNYQPFHIYVLQGELAESVLPRITPCNYNAPLNLIVTKDVHASWKNKNNGYDGADIDVGIVGTHIMLAAEDLGLGCCWIGMLKFDVIADILGLPQNEVPIAMFEIGYPTENAAPAPMHHEYKSLDQLVTYVTEDKSL